MSKFSKIIVISDHESIQHLTLLSQSMGIQVSQKSRSEVMLTHPDQKTLIAYPCFGKKLDHRLLSQDLQLLQQRSSVFLYQAEKNLIDLPLALLSGLRGVIYREDALDKVMTALQSLIKGQLYFPRAVLSAVVDDLFVQHMPVCSDRTPLLPVTMLTKQERNILLLVAQGARNKEIAESLHISAHTVKAHMSTIFRKTQARNRVELLRWYQQQQAQTPQPAFVRFG